MLAAFHAGGERAAPEAVPTEIQHFEGCRCTSRRWPPSPAGDRLGIEVGQGRGSRPSPRRYRWRWKRGRSVVPAVTRRAAKSGRARYGRWTQERLPSTALGGDLHPRVHFRILRRPEAEAASVGGADILNQAPRPRPGHALRVARLTARSSSRGWRMSSHCQFRAGNAEIVYACYRAMSPVLRRWRNGGAIARDVGWVWWRRLVLPRGPNLAPRLRQVGETRRLPRGRSRRWC